MFSFSFFDNLLNYNSLNINFFFKCFFSVNLDYVAFNNIFFFDPSFKNTFYSYFDYSKKKPFFVLENPIVFDLAWGRYKTRNKLVVLSENKLENSYVYIFVKFLKNTKYFLYLKNCELSTFLSKKQNFIFTAFYCYIVFIVVWLVIDAIVSFIYLVSFKREDIFNNYNNSTKFVIESEKEIASVDDLIPLMAGFLSMFSFFFIASSYILSEPFSLEGIFCMGFPSFFFFIIFMPINLVYDGGNHTSFFLRGACNTTIFLLEFLYDILCTTIMFIRLFIQNIRFVLMFFAFLEICEFIYNTTFFEYFLYSNIKLSFLKNSQKSFVMSIIANLEMFLNIFIFYFYNIAHLLYETISHFFAYIILVFWFFFFLYTTFLNNRLEKYFKIITR